MKPPIIKVILTYTTRSRRSVWKTDAGIEDARRFAAEWAAYDHVATVTIKGRGLLEITKPQQQPTQQQP